MQRWMVTALAGGCGGFEPIAVEVEPAGETPLISWDIGPVHEVSVSACDEGCEGACDEPGYLLFGSSSRVWSLGFDEDRLLGEVAGSAPQLVGPVTYGDLEVAGNEREDPAQALEPGVQYGVEVIVYEPCRDSEPNCGHTRAVGCSLFEIEAAD